MESARFIGGPREEARGWGERVARAAAVARPEPLGRKRVWERERLRRSGPTRQLVGAWTSLRVQVPPRAFGPAMELEESGVREECGVFGCIASGEWPTQLDVPHVITLGLVGLQHR